MRFKKDKPIPSTNYCVNLQLKYWSIEYRAYRSKPSYEARVSFEEPDKDYDEGITQTHEESFETRQEALDWIDSILIPKPKEAII